MTTPQNTTSLDRALRDLLTEMTPPRPLDTTHVDLTAMARRIATERHGFYTQDDIAVLAAHPEGRLTPVLVRCGGCRFTCPAQDVDHLIACVTAGGDYVRDVSQPAASTSRDRGPR